MSRRVGRAGGKKTAGVERRGLGAGCGRWVKPGKVVCREHAQTEVGRAIAAEVRELVAALGRLRDVAVADGKAERRKDGEIERREAEGEVRAAVRALRRRVEWGDFAGVLAGPRRVREAEAARERGFADEIEGLRMTLYRVLGEVDLDVVVQAQAMTQVVGMTVRAAREQAAVTKAGEREEMRGAVALLELLGATREPKD